MDISKDFVVLRDIVKQLHAAYLQRYSSEIGEVIATDVLEESRVLAKLGLVAKLFVDAGMVSGSREVSPVAQFGRFGRSIELFFQPSSRSIFLLNGGNRIFVTDAIGKGSSDPLSRGIMALSSDKSIYKEFAAPLSAGFDWESFVRFVADAIHKVIYDRDEVVRLHFLRSVGGNGNEQAGENGGT